MTSELSLLCQRICVGEEVTSLFMVFQETLQKLCYVWEIQLIWLFNGS